MSDYYDKWKNVQTSSYAGDLRNYVGEKKTVSMFYLVSRDNSVGVADPLISRKNLFHKYSGHSNVSVL